MAVVVTHGQEGPTANLQAPVVMGLSSRQGRQVILSRDDLALRQPITLPLGTPANDQNTTADVPAAASDE
jgi:flagellar assembly factor FliW